MTTTPRSWRVDTHGIDEDLETVRFASRQEAEEVADATEAVSEEYFPPQVLPSDDAPGDLTAHDFLTAAWADYPGPRPEGMSWLDWLEANGLD